VLPRHLGGNRELQGLKWDRHTASPGVGHHSTPLGHLAGARFPQEARLAFILVHHDASIRVLFNLLLPPGLLVSTQDNPLAVGEQMLKNAHSCN
jgi:hypothetical protein